MSPHVSTSRINASVRLAPAVGSSCHRRFAKRADCVDEAEKWKVDSAGVTENRFARLSLDAPRRYHVMMLPIAEETNVGYIVDVMPFLKIASQQAPTRNARASGRPPSDINGSN
ncbi:hypothetical protein HBI56_004010 [Parastagonospora nodorum]|uniref:Uncharacterized protein n=1 Tax=Phaeosphaeria nodorum (strain SN15 / ATCC MYA-4574 / FGSC 10173) TaxID=321614 RepID=Q0V5A6_PHANO|nr:hypothetical protein SNOG_00808 [Parastagonospora nodorum SN15]KAH4041775.1 hypothetical protein HBI09_004350 [Parastagonospora nodorum]EAT92303.1 hypothetical protein SNOG_00808 [Parastagonospora nodorum SN15]KAH4165994.1 hypothetical protein HBH43_135110 [Parastagonospora nodorum]KAH4208077.1 hypothetical protein HBI95_099220 [Parastagonospora nodorum]KAH4421737.1 hypothetical protein HBH92_004820 [Parastagonospora nodorum]